MSCLVKCCLVHEAVPSSRSCAMRKCFVASRVHVCAVARGVVGLCRINFIRAPAGCGDHCAALRHLRLRIGRGLALLTYLELAQPVQCSMSTSRVQCCCDCCHQQSVARMLTLAIYQRFWKSLKYADQGVVLDGLVGRERHVVVRLRYQHRYRVWWRCAIARLACVECQADFCLGR